MARVLQNAVVSTGLSCWRDERWLAPGDDFAVEITRAIRECNAFVLLLSPASNSSDYVSREVAIAHHFKKLIVPVLLKATDIADGLLPYLIRLNRWDLGTYDASNFAASLKAKLIQCEADRAISHSISNEPLISTLDASPFVWYNVPLVTDMEYHAFLSESERKRMPHRSPSDLCFPEVHSGSPVTRVSWDDAVAYCDWAGSRLPRPSRNLSMVDVTTVSANSEAIYEWHDAGAVNYKQVRDPRTSILMAVMERDARRSDIGFRSIPVDPPSQQNWVCIDSGHWSLGTDIAAFTRLTTTYGLHPILSRPILNRGVRQYRLHDYAISSTCVTNEEFYAFTRATGGPWPRHWDAKWLSRSQRPFPMRIASQPVVNVSVENAQAYCIWSRTRLPTWMEWERAACGPARQPYPWGQEYNAHHCNSVESECGSLVTVDDYPSGDSPEGVHQLCGNVAEWVLSPEGSFEHRGGSYCLPCELWGLVYAFRRTEPGVHAPDVGFRVVSD